MVRTYDQNPLSGNPQDPQGLSVMLHEYLTWMEVHHYSPATATVRRIILSMFVQWCLDRSVIQSRRVTAQLMDRYQRHLFHYRKRDGEQIGRAHV